MEKIVEVCKSHHVKSLFLFGSAARESDFGPASDIDFLVEFSSPDPTTNEQVMTFVSNKDGLKAALQSVVNREVDLLHNKYVRNRYLKYFIDKDKQLLYAIS